ncbi:MAG: hypothetical protein OXK73_03425 [Rhodospirillaceae bacterium]|nr:hypothetical protein [Rhodospirillaceae bacterium]
MSLAEALIAFVADISGPFVTLVQIICWILGLCLLFMTALRLLKHSDSFGKGAPPAAVGTAATFLAAVILLQLPSWLDAVSTTLLGSGGKRTRAILGYGEDHANLDELLAAVFTIVALVGLVAFVRGIFVLRACSDGKPSATAGSAAMHIFGGAAAWHMTTVLDALQTTLGIRILDIN